MGTVSNVRTKNENTIVIMPYLTVQPIFDCSDCDDNVMLVTLNADMDDRIRIHPVSCIPCIKIRQLSLKISYTVWFLWSKCERRPSARAEVTVFLVTFGMHLLCN